MLSLIRIARKADALEAGLETRRAESRRRLVLLREGVHRRLVSPTAMASGFAAGIVAGTLSRPDDAEGGRRRGGTPLRRALRYGGWLLRGYLTQKVAAGLRSI